MEVRFGLGGWMLFSTEIKEFRTIRMALYNVIGAMWQGLPQDVTDFGKIGYLFTLTISVPLVSSFQSVVWRSILDFQWLILAELNNCYSNGSVGVSHRAAVTCRE